MYGQFPRNFGEKLLDYEQSRGWLKFGDIKASKDTTILTAQNKAIGLVQKYDE